MRRIYARDGASFVWQWQPKEHIVLEDYPDGVFVRYSNCDTVEAPVVQTRRDGDKLIADIPPELMQVDKDITVYVCDEDGIIHCHFLSVVGSPKPASYIYEPVEVLRYESLAAKIPFDDSYNGKLLYVVDGVARTLSPGDGVEIVRQEDGSYVLVAAGAGNATLSDSFIVTVTIDEDSNAVEADRTVPEILEAARADKYVFCKITAGDGYATLPLVGIDSDQAKFTGMVGQALGTVELSDSGNRFFSQLIVGAVDGVLPDESGNIVLDVPRTPEDIGALPAGTKIPAKTSDLSNDSGFITKTVADLVNYYTKTQTEELIAQIPKFRISVVQQLPTVGEELVLYLVPFATAEGQYLEYIWVGGRYEVIGSQKIDLSGYATEIWVQAGYQPKGNYLLATALPGAIEDALAQAKASGEFDGTDGTTPHIGANGNWYIGSTDTGIKAQGPAGAAGRGIKSITRTSGNGAAGTVDTYTITYTDGTTSTFQVRNGADGSPGDDGITPHIGDNGNWFVGDIDTGKPSRGAAGEPGLTWRGEWDDEAGYRYGDVVSYRGSAYIHVYDFAHTVAPTGIEPGTDESTWAVLAEKGADGEKPVRGVDYYTSADKAEMVQSVVEALPKYDGGVV